LNPSTASEIAAPGKTATCGAPLDAADMFVRLLRGDLGSAETTAVLLGILKAQQLRHALPAWLRPDTTVAHKTGGLPGVVNDAGIMFLPRGPVVAAVFTNDLVQNAEGNRAIQEIGRAIADAAR
jgi:beta-lactamase class A